MTDSLNQPLRDTRRDPTPAEAHQVTFHIGSEAELAALQSQGKPPDLLGGRPAARPHPQGPEAAHRGLPPHQFASARRLREEFGLATPYNEGKRIGYGLLWTGWTLLLASAGVSLLPHGSTVLPGLIAFALAIITGRYAYRIWTWQAKRLFFFIMWVLTPLLIAGVLGAQPAVAGAATQLAASPARAATSSSCGQTLVPGTAWAGSWASRGNVDVNSNGSDMGTLNSCAGSGTYGPRYQCTELAQRWAAVAWGEPATWIGYAYTAWTRGTSLPNPLIQYSNGGSTPPQFGDLIVFGAAGNDTSGHIAVVRGLLTVNGSRYVDIVEQNWNSDGGVGEYVHLPLSSGNYIPPRPLGNGTSLPVLGWMAPKGWNGPAAGKPATVLTGDGHIQVFWVSNGILSENWFNPGNGQVGGGSSVGGMTVQGTPALVARSGQTVIDAFIRNSSGQIEETWYNWGTGQWGGWITVDGGSFSSDPSAVATADGHDQVFATSNGTLAMNWFNPGNGQVGGGSSVGGMTVQGTPALVARSGQTVIDAFIRNSSGQIEETWYNWGTGQWGGWITVDGGSFSSDPSAVATADGHDQVFATSNGTLAMNWFNPGNGQVGGGSSVGGITVQGTPALVARSGQTVIDAFIRNSSGQIEETWYNWGTGQWGGWIPIGGATFTSDSTSVPTSDGHDQVFAMAGSTPEENWFDAGSGNVGGWVAI